jgi:hypothetical protein
LCAILWAQDHLRLRLTVRGLVVLLGGGALSSDGDDSVPPRVTVQGSEIRVFFEDQNYSYRYDCDGFVQE